MMTTLQALIFDVDGTLAETERDGHRVAFNQAFAAAGLPWHWSQGIYGVLLQVAGGKERIHFFIEKYAPPLPVGCDLDELIAEIHHAKTGYYTALLQSGQISLRPGIKRLINEARQQNIRLAIATTSRLENALALLETALAPDAPSWFEVIAAGDIVPRKKPAADIYHYVLDKMALAPQNCLVIEDTEHGLTAAQGAGLTTVITVNDYTKRQNFAAAALVLNHLGKPDQPCQSLWGHPLTQPYFDLSVARSLVALSEPPNLSCVAKRLRDGD
jgi:HAD superfamily hydrolase (TIGR01509 family)